MSDIKKITERGKWPECTAVSRKSSSDSRLFCDVLFPALDERDEDYHVQITSAAADPQTEKRLIELCIHAIDMLPGVIDTLQFAHKKLDSVAFLVNEGDTRFAKQSIENILEKLRDWEIEP